MASRGRGTQHKHARRFPGPAFSRGRGSPNGFNQGGPPGPGMPEFWGGPPPFEGWVGFERPPFEDGPFGPDFHREGRGPGRPFPPGIPQDVKKQQWQRGRGPNSGRGAPFQGPAGRLPPGQRRPDSWQDQGPDNDIGTRLLMQAQAERFSNQGLHNPHSPSLARRGSLPGGRGDFHEGASWQRPVHEDRPLTIEVRPEIRLTGLPLPSPPASTPGNEHAGIQALEKAPDGRLIEPFPVGVTLPGPVCEGTNGDHWYYIDLSKEIQGPYDLPQLKDWMEDGYFDASQLVRRDTSEIWTYLGLARSPPPGRPQFPSVVPAQQPILPAQQPPLPPVPTQPPLPPESFHHDIPSTAGFLGALSHPALSPLSDDGRQMDNSVRFSDFSGPLRPWPPPLVPAGSQQVVLDGSQPPLPADSQPPLPGGNQPFLPGEGQAWQQSSESWNLPEAPWVNSQEVWTNQPDVPPHQPDLPVHEPVLPLKAWEATPSTTNVPQQVLMNGSVGHGYEAVTPESSPARVTELPEKAGKSIDKRVESLMKGRDFSLGGDKMHAVISTLKEAMVKKQDKDVAEFEGIVQAPPDQPSHQSTANQLAEKQAAYAPYLGEQHEQPSRPLDLEHRLGVPQAAHGDGVWLSRGGDWSLLHDPQLAPDGEPSKRILNNAQPLCSLETSSQEKAYDPRKQPSYTDSLPPVKLELPPWACWGVGETGPSETGLADTPTASRHTTPVPSRATTPQNDTPLSTPKTPHGKPPLYSPPGVKSRAKGKAPAKKKGHPEITGVLERNMQLTLQWQGGKGNAEKKASPAAEVEKKSPPLTSKSPQPTEKSPPQVQETRVAEEVQEERAESAVQLGPEEGEWFTIDGTGRAHEPRPLPVLRWLVAQGSIRAGVSAWRKADDKWVILSGGPMPEFLQGGPGFVPLLGRPGRGAPPLPFEGPRGRFPRRISPPPSGPLSEALAMVRGRLHEAVMKGLRRFVLEETIDKCLDEREASRKRAAEKEADENRPLRRAKGEPSEDEDEPEEGEVVEGLSEDKHTLEDELKDLKEDSQEGVDVTVLEQRGDSFGSWYQADKARGLEALRLVILIGLAGGPIGHDARVLGQVATVSRVCHQASNSIKAILRRLDLSKAGSDAALKSSYPKLQTLCLYNCKNITLEALESFLQAHQNLQKVDIRGCPQSRCLAERPEFPNIEFVITHRPSLMLSTEGVSSGRKAVEKLVHGLKRVLEEIGTAQVLTSLDSQAEASGLHKPGQYLLSLNKRLSEGKYSEAYGLSMFRKDLDHRLQRLLRKFESDFQTHEDLLELQSRASRLLDELDIELRGLFRKFASNGLPKHLDIYGSYRRPSPTFNKPQVSEEGASSADESGSRKRHRHLENVPSRKKQKLEKRRPSDKFSEKKSRLQALIASRKEVERKELVKLKEKKDLSAKKTPKGEGAKRKEEDDSEEEFWDSENEDSSEAESDPLSICDDEESDGHADNADISDEMDDFLMEEADEDVQLGRRNWGAKMTKQSMVPPVTRTYDVIDDYVVVAEPEEVARKMKAEVPLEFQNRAVVQERKERSMDYLDVPEVRQKEERKELASEVKEQEVYGIDPYTHNLLLDTMPKGDKHWCGEGERDRRSEFIEDKLLMALNQEAEKYTGSDRKPEFLELQPILVKVIESAKQEKDHPTLVFAEGLLANMKAREEDKDKFLAYRKGLGVICSKKGGIKRDDFLVEFFGEVYPPWRWYEKQDEIKSLLNKEQTPEFYNIYLERPKGDAKGYDLLVVDAMHKANYASRLCHACLPNCEVRTTATDGKYMIGVYTVRDVQYGEELTFDYCSVTEDFNEYKKSVCLCGSRHCRGSYLNFGGAKTFSQVINQKHGLLDRHDMLLKACSNEPLTSDEQQALLHVGFKDCLLENLPQWARKYAAKVCLFVLEEKRLLPYELLQQSKRGQMKKKKSADQEYHFDARMAEGEAEGVFLQRIQNLAITLDKVRYCLKNVLPTTPPSQAPPPLRLLSPSEAIDLLWSGEYSIVNQLFYLMQRHIKAEEFARLREGYAGFEFGSGEEGRERVKEAMLWLREELLLLRCSDAARHDAAADLVHIYAHTKYFFTSEDYVGKSFTSLPVEIVDMDLGYYGTKEEPRLRAKEYKPNYIWGQLMSWFRQTNQDPGGSLPQLRRGCLSLPDPSSCYSTNSAAIMKSYGKLDRDLMLENMVDKPQKPWTKKVSGSSSFWEFTNRDWFGSPMLDAVIDKRPINGDIVRWLRDRPATFSSAYDNPGIQSQHKSSR